MTSSNKSMLETAINLAKSNNSEPISTGSYTVHKVFIDNTPYILKSYGDVVINSKKQRKILSLLEKEVGGIKYRASYHKLSGVPRKVMELESKVLNNWEREGIHAPRVIASNGTNDLLLDYINGENLKDRIHNLGYTRSLRDDLLGSINKIRLKAFEKRDPYMLHNDMWVSNFMVNGSDKTVPIDPGLLFKPEIGFEKLDAHVNLFFCYSLLSEYFGFSNGTKDSNYDLLANFITSLDGPTLQRMKEANIPANRLELAYLSGTSYLGFNKKYNGFVQSFKPENCRLIENKIIETLEDKSSYS